MEFKDFLNEGIDIDYRNNTVSFNDFHERDVDTSLKNNPVKSKIGLKNINVWSIFTRKDDTTNDGNPLIYALKGERGWKFKDINDKDILLIDDTISRGQTIKEACNAILDTYNPKSITVLLYFQRNISEENANNY